jgi:hypothetical protein
MVDQKDLVGQSSKSDVLWGLRHAVCLAIIDVHSERVQYLSFLAFLQSDIQMQRGLQLASYGLLDLLVCMTYLIIFSYGVSETYPVGMMQPAFWAPGG